MRTLHFPSYSFRFKNTENTRYIFDPIRKKFVVLQPEEWVRQHVVQHLHKDLGYPLSHINVEKKLLVNGLVRRFDVVVFTPDGDVLILIECKAFDVKIVQSTFDQLARYNRSLNSRYLVVTNGLDHYAFEQQAKHGSYRFLDILPDYGFSNRTPLDEEKERNG